MQCQFNSPKLPIVTPASMPPCILVVVAAMVNEGVLLVVFGETLQKEGGLSPSEAVARAAKIRFHPRLAAKAISVHNIR